jgi:hypothetical protein
MLVCPGLISTACAAHRRPVVVYDGAMLRAVALSLLLGCGSVDAVRDAGNVIDATSALPDASDASSSPADAAPDAPDAPAFADGLIAWYQMDAPANRKVVDATGHHEGTCSTTSCPSFNATGLVGGSYVFDGVEQIVHVPSMSELQLTTGFTVSVWINRAPNSKDGCFINQLLGTGSDNSWQACSRDTGAMFFFTQGGATQDTQEVVVNLAPRTWNHIALWWDGSRKRTYVNGERKAETGVTAIDFDTQDLTIGSDIDLGVLAVPFAGQIDDVRIYNRALSDTEIFALQSP